MIESVIFIWFNRLLSRRGRLVLLKLMLESIPMYWSSIVVIPQGIPSIIHKVNFQYCWLGKWNVGCIPLSRCLSSYAPKGLGGWGQNTIIIFTQALVEHSLWVLVHNNSLWAWVLCSKYLPNYSIIEWFGWPTKSTKGLIVWKAIVTTLPLVGDWNIWNISDGK
jgi:hypothetical protein